MQAGKNAAASLKETAGNVAASAKSGMDKTKATVQEKVDKMKAHSPAEKEMAAERKQERMLEAECNKQEAIDNNAAARQQTQAGGRVAHAGYYPTEGPTGSEVGTARPSAAHDPLLGTR